jgi:hypothetical protein
VTARNPRRGVHSHMTGKEFREDQAACRQRTRPDFALGTFTNGRMYRVIKHPQYLHGHQIGVSDQIVRRWPKVRGKKARAAEKRQRRQEARCAA